MKIKNSSNSSEDLGNNIVKSSKQISCCIRWCFTFNNYEENIVLKFQDLLKIFCKKAFFHREVAPSTGTKHLQGYLEFKKKNRPLSVFDNKIFKINWDKAKGTLEENWEYCGKTANGKIDFSLGITIPKKIKIITNLKPFQKSIVDIVEGDVNEGKIIWIYDKKGQIGKTELCRYLHVKYNCPFTYGGKKNDIINLVFNNKKYMLDNDKAIMIYNLPRETKKNEISYHSMEAISDGCIANNKFEAGCFVCNKPHVLVFANCLPLVESMTKSRWLIKCVDDDENLIDYIEPEELEIDDELQF